jgi:hypothetical protein
MNEQALRDEYARVITARFVTKRDGTPMHCVTCNAVLIQGTALAAVTHDTKQWHSYCPACADDRAVQIRGLFSRLLEMSVAIPQPIADLVRAFLDHEDRDTFLAAKRALMGLRADAGRDAAATREANGLDLSNVPAGTYAVPGGDTRLKVKVDHGKAGTKWEGWTFVKDAAAYGQGQRYGSQRPGQTYRGKIEDALRVIASDPIAAFAEYGRLTGTCGVCGRPLEDEQSVARGIGPICWGRLTD